MNCSIKKEDLIAFIYGEIDEQKKKIIEEHIKSCPECAQEVASLKKDSSILKKWKVDVPPVDIAFLKEKQSFNTNVGEKFAWLRAKPLRFAYMFAAAAAVIGVIAHG